MIRIGKGIVMGKDSNLLACNGGGIVLTKDWARNVLRTMSEEQMLKLKLQLRNLMKLRNYF